MKNKKINLKYLFLIIPIGLILVLSLTYLANKNQAVNWHKLEQSYDQQGQQGFTLVKQNKKDKLYGKLVLFQLKAHAKAHVGI